MFSWRWKLGILFVLIFGFTGLLFMGYKTYLEAPPIPDKVIAQDGTVLFTGKDILAGQAVFQKHGLMDVGSLWGHGAYNGPDFSADYLHRMGLIAADRIAQQQYGTGYEQLSEEQQSVVQAQLKKEFKQNRYDAKTKTLTLTDDQVAAYKALQPHYAELFSDGSKLALPRNYIKTQEEQLQLNRFFHWSAWATVTNRPGKDHTYTNDWPADKLVGNGPNGQVFIWSVLSLVLLIGGIGATQFILGKFPDLGWVPNDTKSSRLTDDVKSFRPTRAQRSVYPYLLVVVCLFLLQAICGGLTVHYMVEPEGFYGFDIRQFLPYSITRTWHIQLAILWIATAWLAGGMFLAPMISRNEPKGQHWLVKILFGALVFVAVGSMIGEWLGIQGMLGDLWFWLGHQGWEYLELGRAWQILLTVGMVIWTVIILRSIAPMLKGQDKFSLPYMLLYGVVSIPVFFAFGMMYGPTTNFAVADFWRWWVVHLWVEGFFELFTTIIVAYFFHSLGMVSARSALSVIYLDIMLYLGGGLIGTGHHYYWTGQPAVNMALGGMFSALEVVPLTLLTVEAWTFARLRKLSPTIDANPKEALAAESGKGHGGLRALDKPQTPAHKWAMMFLLAVGFWNFLGAGIFGFLVNMPIVNYFEHATYLTVNHGHGAMVGVYGMLAVAAVLFVGRYLIKPEAWNDKLMAFSFWSLNIGLFLMLALSVFPAGVVQLLASYEHGFWYARSYEFIHSDLFQSLIWLRMIGDTIFIAGILPLVYMFVRGIFFLRPSQPKLRPLPLITEERVQPLEEPALLA